MTQPWNELTWSYFYNLYYFYGEVGAGNGEKINLFILNFEYIQNKKY